MGFPGTNVSSTKNHTPKKMLRRSISQKSTLLLIFVFFCGIFTGEYLRNGSSRHKSVHLRRVDAYCAKFKYPKDLVIVLKTGANEVYDKVPTQLLTSLSCYRDILVFSDLEQRFGGYHVHDALENVPMTVQRGNAEFNYYYKLRHYKKHGKDVGKLRETDGTAAWELDKYKFLHMMEDTWRLRPGRKWYFFLEADTYLVQSNLFHWLRRMDSSKLHYYGSHAYHKAPFAHGGSGFLLSGVALAKFVKGDHEVIDRHDELMKQEPFGDYVLSQALVAKGVNLTNAAPMLSAEKPTTLPFGPGPAGIDSHWCRPIVTMHHITPQEASSLWELEQYRPDPTAPLLYEDLYKSMIAGDMPATRDDWDNLSEHSYVRPPGTPGDRQKVLADMSITQQEAHLSFEKCGRACEEDNRCFQYTYSNHTCGFSWFFRMGSRREPEDGISFQSGWNLDKIARYQAEHVCKLSSARWVDPPRDPPKNNNIIGSNSIKTT